MDASAADPTFRRPLDAPAPYQIARLAEALSTIRAVRRAHLLEAGGLRGQAAPTLLLVVELAPDTAGNAVDAAVQAAVEDCWAGRLPSLLLKTHDPLLALAARAGGEIPLPRPTLARWWRR